MAISKNEKPLSSRQTGEGATGTILSEGDIVAYATLYPQGVRFKQRGGRVLTGRNVPTNKRKENDIQGFSKDSRRRFRDFFLRHEPIPDCFVWHGQLTVPPLPEGSDGVTIGRDESRDLWKGVQRWLTRQGWGCIWRLEVQPRTNTKRADLRGIEQPHWHLIGVSPAATSGADVAPDLLRGEWLRLLGPRGVVKGADREAFRGGLMDGLTESQIRYMTDHASKHKRDQVAVGWGRHWGVVGRDLWQDSESVVYELTRRQWIEAGRLVRRWHRRRVPDLRSTGGLDLRWESSPDKQGRGHWLSFVGGSVLVPGWDGVALTDQGKRLWARCLGKARRNIWAMRLAPRMKLKSKRQEPIEGAMPRMRGCRSTAGQWFGGNGASKLLAWVTRSP